jgi:hypothetical protein
VTTCQATPGCDRSGILTTYDDAGNALPACFECRAKRVFCYATVGCRRKGTITLYDEWHKPYTSCAECLEADPSIIDYGPPEEEEDDDDGSCRVCGGSGGGDYPGIYCYSCRGSGITYVERE